MLDLFLACVRQSIAQSSQAAARELFIESAKRNAETGGGGCRVTGRETARFADKVGLIGSQPVGQGGRFGLQRQIVGCRDGLVETESETFRLCLQLARIAAPFLLPQPCDLVG